MVSLDDYMLGFGAGAEIDEGYDPYEEVGITAADITKPIKPRAKPFRAGSALYVAAGLAGGLALLKYLRVF